MKITILGSCRQDSIYNLYPVTSIRNNLSYPHYTKEIIEVIEFCSKKKRYPTADTIYIFRSAILDRKVMNPNLFFKEFNETDLFVLEICSRKAYTYNGYYVHHILSETNYGFTDIQNIKVYHQTDKEIEEDILKMKELLSPKPFFIIGHICTYSHGSRYELIQLLKKLCEKYNIPFFNTMEELQGYSIDSLYEKDNKLIHYTQFGHTVFRQKYKEFIDKYYNGKLDSLQN
jgi:hypothetical protein